jgi:hypothetical protein
MSENNASLPHETASGTHSTEAATLAGNQTTAIVPAAYVIPRLDTDTCNDTYEIKITLKFLPF